MAKKTSSEHDREEGPDPSQTPLDNELVRARALGEISADASFNLLYRAYRATVLAWLSLRAEHAFVEDLAQDVWLIFYGRWQRWEYGVEAESEKARPVLSFLFRTCHFVAKGHRRSSAVRLHQSQEELSEPASPIGADELMRSVEADRCLEIARTVCSREELDVLGAKLAGLSAREIAEALDLTEAVVDHRYRNALTHIKKKIKLVRRRGAND